MDQSHHPFKQPDPFITDSGWNQSAVYQPGENLEPLELHERLETRQFLASPFGRHFAEVAAVRRSTGQRPSVAVRHSSARVPDQSFDAAVLLHVAPESVQLWGRRGATRGVWKMSPMGSAFVADLYAADWIMPSRIDAIPVYNGPHGLQYVSGGRLVTLPSNSELAFDADGRVRGVVPGYADRHGDRFWFIPPDPDQDSALSGHNMVGNPVWPLPFRAKHAHASRVDEYVLQRGDRYWLCRMKDGLPEEVPLVEGVGIDYVWSSPANTVAVLNRRHLSSGGYVRRLNVNTRVVHEGRFFMRRGGFVWSASGENFVAHITLLERSGVRKGKEVMRQGSEMLLTSTGESLVIPERATVHEPAIDDEGRLSYIYADGYGRRLVCNGVATHAFPYAWNLRADPTGDIIANALCRDTDIYRIEFPCSR